MWPQGEKPADFSPRARPPEREWDPVSMAVSLVAAGPSFPPASILASPQRRLSNEVQTRSVTGFLCRNNHSCPTGGCSSQCWEATLSRLDLRGPQDAATSRINCKEVF